MTDETNTALSVRKIMEDYAAVTIDNIKRGGPDEVAVAVLPSGKTIHSLKKFLDEYAIRPERRKGVSAQLTLESFIDHVNRFKGVNSAIFADNNMADPGIISVFNYHQAGYDGLPEYGDHRSSYDFPLSDEWEVWHGAGGVRSFDNQSDFAEFLENNIDDVYFYDGGIPKIDEFKEKQGWNFASPSTLMALSRNINVTNNEQVTQKINPDTGECQLVYSQEHGGTTIKPPNAFVIAIPVFLNGPIYMQVVRLRYRVSGARVKWSYELYRPRKTFEAAFDTSLEEVKLKTELPLFIGKPE